jgi:hypothetical protein
MSKYKAVKVSSNLVNHPRIRDILSAPTHKEICSRCHTIVHEGQLNNDGLCRECSSYGYVMGIR